MDVPERLFSFVGNVFFTFVGGRVFNVFFPFVEGRLFHACSGYPQPGPSVFVYVLCVFALKRRLRVAKP